MTTETYIATAYRWGELNGHRYLVAAGTDRDLVIQAASAEVRERSGKYGVEVVSLTLTGEQKRVAYLPSMCDEPAPRHNHRVDLAERIGHIVRDAVDDGTTWEPDPEANRTGVQRQVPVEVPDWLRAAVERERKRAEVMVRAMNAGSRDEEEEGADHSETIANLSRALTAHALLDAIGERDEAAAIVRDLADSAFTRKRGDHLDGVRIQCALCGDNADDHTDPDCPYLRARAFVAREGREDPR